MQKLDTENLSPVLKSVGAEVLGQRTPKVLEVLTWPDKRLCRVSTAVTTNICDDEPLQELMDDMVATMNAYRATGLAAIQVGVDLRVLVVRDQKDVVKIINPIIKSTEGSIHQREGCLSFPGLYVAIRRPEELVIEYHNEKGVRKTTVGRGLLARAIAHEMDHLDGLTFLDRVPRFNRVEIVKNYNRLQKKINRAVGTGR